MQILSKSNQIEGQSYTDPLDVVCGRVQPDNFIVSRNIDGSALSIYSDEYWDRSPYQQNGKTFRLSFKYWTKGETTVLRESIANEIRWCLFVVIFLRDGPVLANGTLRHYQIMFFAMARFSEAKGIRLKELLSNDEFFLECLNNNAKGVHFGRAFIRLLSALGKEVVGFETVTNSALKKLTDNFYEKNLKPNQVCPIPTRIYSNILSQLSLELDEVELQISNILALYDDISSDPMRGKCVSNQYLSKKNMGRSDLPYQPTFKQLIQKYGLEEFWHKRQYISKSKAGLSSMLIEVMCICAHQIQAFTGMRIGEVQTLPLDCIVEHQDSLSKTNHYLLDGFTTKFSNGKNTPAQWVTSESGIRAVRLLQRISRAVYKARGANPDEPKNDGYTFRLLITPWFIKNRRNNAPPYLNLDNYKELKSRLISTIEESDVLELEQIDPHRDWRSDSEIKVGSPWNFKSHQLRRSLALYAQRSGLVSLPSLKRQLQHITQEMSAYYARGARYARDFIFSDKEHFSSEWREAQPLSQYLSYAFNVLFDDQQSFGPHKNWVDKKLVSQKIEVLFDRKVTLDRFKKGEIAYKETILGGCVKVGECDKNPLDLLHIDCLTTHCKNLVGNREKLNRLIKAESNLVERLKSSSPDSSTFRHESANLKVLTDTLKHISKT